MLSSVCSVVYCKLEPGCRKTEGLRVSGCRKTEGFRQTLEENREPNDRVYSAVDSVACAVPIV